jgi:hypothetical protein
VSGWGWPSMALYRDLGSDPVMRTSFILGAFFGPLALVGFDVTETRHSYAEHVGVIAGDLLLWKLGCLAAIIFLPLIYAGREDHPVLCALSGAYLLEGVAKSPVPPHQSFWASMLTPRLILLPSDPVTGGLYTGMFGLLLVVSLFATLVLCRRYSERKPVTHVRRALIAASFVPPIGLIFVFSRWWGFQRAFGRHRPS